METLSCNNHLREYSSPPMKRFMQQITPSKRMYMWRKAMPNTFVSCRLHATEISMKQVKYCA